MVKEETYVRNAVFKVALERCGRSDVHSVYFKVSFFGRVFTEVHFDYDVLDFRKVFVVRVGGSRRDESAEFLDIFSAVTEEKRGEFDVFRSTVGEIIHIFIRIHNAEKRPFGSVAESLYFERNGFGNVKRFVVENSRGQRGFAERSHLSGNVMSFGYELSSAYKVVFSCVPTFFGGLAVNRTFERILADADAEFKAA